jgi:hypothetical protein
VLSSVSNASQLVRNTLSAIIPLPTRKFWSPHITKPRGIAESGGESMWADSPKTLDGEFRDVGIDWNIDIRAMCISSGIPGMDQHDVA